MAGSQPEVVWNAATLQPGAASPIAADGRLFLINTAGVLTCAKMADAQVRRRVRLQGEFWGTPALVGNRLYCISQKGAAQVVEVSDDGRRGEIVGEGQLDGTIQSSPAVSRGALTCAAISIFGKSRPHDAGRTVVAYRVVDHRDSMRPDCPGRHGAAPGSKSLTNRALICAALADGVSRLRGALDSEERA